MEALSLASLEEVKVALVSPHERVVSIHRIFSVLPLQVIPQALVLDLQIGKEKYVVTYHAASA